MGGIVINKRGSTILFNTIKTISPRFIKTKKAQITTFIIIGLVILITIALIMYLKSEQSIIKEEIVQLSQEPITAYVQTCAKDIAEEAVIKLGQQGGFLEMGGVDTITAQYAPFDSDILTMSDGKLNIPYWYYQKDEGYELIGMPSLYEEYQGDGSIQNQLQEYINTNLLECLNDFETFKEQGMDITSLSPQTRLTFGESSILVSIDMPTEITKTDSTEIINTFEISVPIALKKMYTLAKEITEHEINTQFLEYNTRNFITFYSDTDPDYLPPTTAGVMFTNCADFAYWNYQDVYDNFKQVLMSNIPYIQISDAEYTPYIITKDMESDEDDREFREAIFSHMTQDVSQDNYPGVTTLFNFYPDFPLHLDFGERKGLLKPNTFEADLVVMKLCMFDYSFMYNVKYPVLVTLIDENSIVDNQAYLFQFPLQVIIKDNYPRVRVGDVLDLPIPDFEDDPSYQCAEEQKTSGDITILVQDEEENPIDNAVITFSCGPDYVYSYDENGTVTSMEKFADTCYSGVTEDGVLTTKFPPCYGAGIVTISHPEYLEISGLTGDISPGSSFTKIFTLPKVYTKNIELRKYLVKPPAREGEEMANPGIVLDDEDNVIECNAEIELGDKPLQPYESALVTLTKLDEENGVLITPPVVLYDISTPQTIDIAQGEYNIDITLMRSERYLGELTIKKNSQSMTVPDGAFSEETIYYPEDDVLIEQAFTGGLNTEWTVSSSQLKNSDTLVFYIFDEDAPNRIEDVGAPMGHIETCSELNPLLIEPRLE